MSGEKPAPTAAEIAEARRFYTGPAWFVMPPACLATARVLIAALDTAEREDYLNKQAIRVGGDAIRDLTARLDAAEERATAAEKERDDARTVADESVARHRAWWQEAIRLHSALHSLATDDVHAHLGDGSLATESLCARNGIAALRTRAETAERERDELSDALKLYEAFPELATGDTARRDEQRAAYNGLRWVLGLLAGLDDGRQDSVAKAFRPVVEKIKRERDEARAALKPGAIVVSDTEEARERIARALWDGEGYSEPWGESARNSHPVTYRCVLRDTNAVLAALRESRP